MYPQFPFIFILALFILTFFKHVKAHGRLMEPPARNSMWRLGYPNPANYQDNELFCGGQNVQWSSNGGKCGVCGDPWHVPSPRPHEVGGQYANGIIVNRYLPGQDIPIEVELTTNHYGIFSFHICAYNEPGREVEESCLLRNPLSVVGSNGALYENFKIPRDSPDIRAIFNFNVRLPQYFLCAHCLLRWTYRTGNTWGSCPNGTQETGCGPQETFINCADVAISSAFFYGHGAHRGHPNVIYYKDETKGLDAIEEPLILRSQRCLAVENSTRLAPGMDSWCMNSCMKYPPNCPKDLCYCLTECRARPGRYRDFGKDRACNDKCLRPKPVNCFDDDCICF